MNPPTTNKKEGLLQKFIHSEDGHFAIDTVKNVFWFSVIALSALGLENLVEWGKENGAGDVTIILLTGVEYIVLIADLIWFIARLSLSTYISVSNVWFEMKAHREKLLTKQASGTH